MLRRQSSIFLIQLREVGSYIHIDRLPLVALESTRGEPQQKKFIKGAQLPE